ncbi:MAG: OmpA family protein [bacterium]|nr:OmpA family protein [bacterium]
MKKGQWWIGLMVIGLVVPAVGGCKTLEEYRQLEMSHRTALAEKSQMETELYDARTLADSMRTRLTAGERELETKNQLIASLQRENDRLDEAASLAEQTLRELASRGMPTDPIVLKETRLPAALDSALSEFANQYPNDVDYNEATGAIKWKSDVLFILGSDVVKDTAKASLSRFGEILSSPAAAGFEVVIVGHTDDRRIARESTAKLHPTNWHLSVHRAISVSGIILQGGYDAARVGVMGYGEYRPVASNDTADSRAHNRRVEIYLVEQGALQVSPHHANVFTVPELGLAFAKATP